MYWLKRMSFQRRLVIAVILLVSVIILGNTLFDYKFQIEKAKQNLVQDTVIANRILSRDYIRLLFLNDLSTAAELTTKHESFPMIKHVDLFNKHQQNLLHFSRQPKESHIAPLISPAKPFFEENQLRIGFDILSGNEKVGEVRYLIEIDKIKHQNSIIFQSNIVTAIVSLIVAFFGSSFVGRILSSKESHILFLENMDLVNKSIQQSKNADEMLNRVLKDIQHILNSDRAWLLYPCNPDAKVWSVPMEVTKPGYPGAHVLGQDIAMDDDVQNLFRSALNNADFEYINFISSGTTNKTLKTFSSLSEMHTVLRPKIGEPWLFGIHQCSHHRRWTEDESNLFKAISARLTDGLNNMLYLRNLVLSEERNRSLLDSTAEAIYGLDLEGLCTFCNNSCLQILGFSSQADLLGKNMHQLIHHKHADGSSYLERDCPIYNAFRNNKKCHIDSEVLFKADGTSFSAEYWSHPTSKDGIVSGCVVTFLDISDRKKQEKQLNYQASHDELTGLFNRYEFERQLTELVELRSAENSLHALCFLDLDQFKVVNDTCGHTVGDEMLRQISLVLLSNLTDQETLARIGGDEFAVLIKNCSIKRASKIASNILDSINNYRFIWDEQIFKVGISIGLVPIDKELGDASDLMMQADTACYAAKNAGKNQVHVYDSNENELVELKGEMQWVTRIHQALEEDRFVLYCQVIVPTSSSDELHYELLLRLLDVDGTIIAPGQFLPAAERYDVIDEIDSWVVEESFRLLESSPEFLNSVTFVSINLSGKSLAKPAFLNRIIELNEKLSIKASKICFEITETAAIANLNFAIKFINKLKSLGFRFALDDFGSGLSSFGYLKNLPVDYLKIDGMFVKDMIIDPIDLEMVKSINNISHVMGMKTIAEFVENEETLSKLQSIGVDYAQGYGVGKPRPLKELLKKGPE